MSSSKPLILKWSEKYSSFKKLFLYYNIYIRNFKFFFNNSQFGEDKKIIKLFDQNTKGIYVDIGCFHPIRQNNTYLMYKQGWSGVNIDLNPLTIDLFNVARPKDINICAAVSNKRGFKNLFFDHQLSSLNTISKNHTLFIKKAFGNKNLDFLNIDVEGHELEVLKTLNFKLFDIKVICIEIVNYDFYSKKIKMNKNKIIKILKKNSYILKFKTYVNYIFVKK